MHKHHIAHLDISLRNLLTDYEGHYAYIDYELSRRFDGADKPYIHGYRGTEVPPECEEGICNNPYKVDVWALAVLILRACKVCIRYPPHTSVHYAKRCITVSRLPRPGAHASR